MKTNEWMDASRLIGRLLILVAMLTGWAAAQPARTMVQDTLYRADGTTATGTVTVRWQGFNTAGGQAVAAGTLTATTDVNGGIAIPLVANVGSTPAGGYYQVVIRLDDGTTSQEQWVVPVAATATLGVVRAQVVPQNVAAQFVSRDFVTGQIDALATVASTGSYTDLVNTPAPVNLQAPGPIGTSTPNSASFTQVCDGNGPVDVMACYGAKGDCATDDHNAILNALTAAYHSTPIRGVKFNRPPGGCYLTSTLPWLGVSLIGVPSGQGNAVAQRTVQIRGKPGQDIFNFPDPNDVASAPPYQGYSVDDIEFVVDDSVDVSASHPWRKLGRTITDAAMTSGSAVLTSATQGQFTRGDVGQQIYVGSVTSGGLLTTIASYQSATQVTLAASATITASGATAYISIAGLSANATVGNCAIAWDNRDGNQSNWKLAMNWANNNSLWNNVTIRGLSGLDYGQNSSCGVFLQPFGMPYNQVWRNAQFLRLEYGFMETPQEVNPAMGFVGGDYFQWYGGNLSLVTIPFVFYNGGQGRIDQVQICALNKPEILQAYSSVETYPGGWHVHIPEDECQNTGGAGWRLEGLDHHFEQTELGGASSPAFPVLWDASNSSCTECDLTGNIQINGNANRLEKLEEGDTFTVTDNGYGNRVVSSSLSIAANSPTRRWAKSITREETVGNKRGDFIQRGLGAYPYNNDADTWLWPSDFSSFYGSYGVVTNDSTSDSGQYLPFYAGGGFMVNTNFSHMNGGTGSPGFAPTIGTAFPASKVTAYIKGKCPTSETITGTVYAYTSSSTQTVVGTFSGSCTSSYGVVAAVPMDLTSYAGDTLAFNLGLTSEFDIAWIAIRPWNGDVLVAGPVQHWASSAAYVGTEAQPTLTANRTWTWPDMSGTVAMTGGNVAPFNLPPTQYDLCGSLDGTSVTCGYNPETITYPPSGSTLAGSTVTFSWTPAVGSTSYYVHLGTTPGAWDLINAGATNATSYTATGIPVLGNTVYLTVVPTVGIGGQATATYTEATAITPLMNGTAAVGASVIPAKADHVHPADTSRAPVASPTFTGTMTTPLTTAGVVTTTSGGVLGSEATVTASQLPAALTNSTSVNGTTIPASSTLMTTSTGVTAAQMPALTGDVTSSAGTVATTVGKINGLAVPASANVVGTNSSGQVALATAHNVSLPANCAQSNTSTTAYTCTTTPTFTPAAGDHIQFEALYANTASSTLAVNGASAATIKKWGGSGTLIANDLLAGHWVSATFDGTYWQLEGQLGNANATQLNGTTLSSLATGLLKNTTSTGVPVIATAGTDYLAPSGAAAISTSSTVSSTSTSTQAVAASSGGVTGKALGGNTAATVAAGAAAGTSPTIACATSHVCSAVNGTVSLTVGTSPATGALLTVTSGLTHTNYPDCMAHVALTASPYTETSNWSWSYSTTVWTLNVGTALTASTAYTVTYECLGY